MVLLAYSIFCVGLALYNNDRISSGKRIYHSLNGGIHLLSAYVVFRLWGIGEAICLLLVARVVFDSALNLMRGLSLGYVSPRPKSIIDRLEKGVFKSNGILPKGIYLVIVLIIQCL
jgi:hypothetical protein